MEPSPAPKVERKGTAKVTSAAFEAGATTLGSLPPPTVPEVAFAGRSNVGKSSLMNALLERKALVRTSSTPGCTRAINLFAVGLDDGAAYRMVDLPGYGYAKLSKAERGRWGEMIEGYLERRTTLRAVVAQQLLRKKIGGRVAAVEILFSNHALSAMIREGKTFQIPGIIAGGKAEGMVGMDESLQRLVEEGVIEGFDALEKAVEKDAFRDWLVSKGVEINPEA